MFAFARSRGLPLEEARTITVNTIVVMQIFYLFNVRHMHGTSLALADLRGTPAVLAGVGGVVLLQLVFTCAPFMAIPFGSAPSDSATDSCSSRSAVCHRRDR